MTRAFSRRTFILGCASGMVAACSFGQAGSAPYGVTLSGEGNALTITRLEKHMPEKHTVVAGDGYLATVQSARGIGQASVAWWGNASPHHLTFNLELAGLEQFSLLWGNQAVNLSVNSVDHSTYVSIRDASGHEAAVTPSSPYWMEVSAMPPDASSFTVVAPEAFITEWPPVWGITWVDFYR